MRQPRPPSVRPIGLLLELCILALLVLPGCEEDITSINTEHPFELYGVLNPAADTQLIRVFPIETDLHAARGEPIDAMVTSTDLESGAVRPWRDSLLAYNDGSYGYLFWAPFRPEEGHTYRIAVTRSDGAQSSAVVTVPMLPEVLDPVGHSIPAMFGGGSSRVHMLEIEYEVQYCWAPPASIKIAVPYEDAARLVGGTYRAEFLLDQDYQYVVHKLIERALYDFRHEVVLIDVRLHTVITNGDWDPPGGDFDPEVLIEPGVMDNVENGFGFVGSGYRYYERLPVDRALFWESGFLRVAPDPPRGEGYRCRYPGGGPVPGW